MIARFQSPEHFRVTHRVGAGKGVPPAGEVLIIHRDGFGICVNLHDRTFEYEFFLASFICLLTVCCCGQQSEKRHEHQTAPEELCFIHPIHPDYLLPFSLTVTMIEHQFVYEEFQVGRISRQVK